MDSDPLQGETCTKSNVTENRQLYLSVGAGKHKFAHSH